MLASLIVGISACYEAVDDSREAKWVLTTNRVADDECWLAHSRIKKVKHLLRPCLKAVKLIHALIPA